jgi:RNA polymerase sigma-70 factor (ECF subfamily)
MSEISNIEGINKTDQDLVVLYLKGNEKALETLIQRHLDAVFNFIMQYVKDVPVAEDIAQEVFVKAWKNLKKFDSKYKFKTWLFVIAKNTALDYLRKKKVFAFSALEKDWLAEGALDQQIILEPLLKQDSLEYAAPDLVYANFSEIKSAAENLPENYRDVLFLHYDMGFNFREISEKLKQSINTIKTRHRRAIIALRKSLG